MINFFAGIHNFGHVLQRVCLILSTVKLNIMLFKYLLINYLKTRIIVLLVNN